MTGSPSVLLAATLGITLLLAPALALFFGGIPDRRRALVLAVAVPATMALAAAEWTLLGAKPEVAIFQGSLAAAAVSAILAVGLRTGRVRGFAVFCALWVVIVLVPVGYALFDVVRGPLAVSVGTLDFGGIGIIALSTGTAASAVVVVSRSLGNAVGGLPKRTGLLFLYCAVTGVVGWMALNIGAELVLDTTTFTLVTNELWAAGAGAVGWTIAQVVNVRRATAAGFVAGAFAGSIVILAASPWFDSTSSVLLGIGAGVLGQVSTVGARRTGSGTWATLIGVCLVPGSLGLVATGIVAHGPGLVFSGHIELLGSQFAGLILILGYSFWLTLLLALVVDRTIRLTGRSRFVDETILRLYEALRAGDDVTVASLVQPDFEWPVESEFAVPVRTRRLRGGAIAVEFDDPEVSHIYREKDGLFDQVLVRYGLPAVSR